MALYRDRVLPRVIDKICGNERIGAWRAKCLDGIGGVVVEPGFGSGTNLPYYPAEVTKVFAVDPATVGQELAAERLADSPIDVEFVGLDGQFLPLDDASCDGGVLTFTLCTIPDPVAALAELRRVIKPGGGLHFCEHGLAPSARMQKLQHLVDPVQKRLFDGCHVSRDHRALIQDAGFVIDWCETDFIETASPWSYLYLGKATNPEARPS